MDIGGVAAAYAFVECYESFEIYEIYAYNFIACFSIRVFEVKRVLISGCVCVPSVVLGIGYLSLMVYVSGSDLVTSLIIRLGHLSLISVLVSGFVLID